MAPLVAWHRLRPMKLICQISIISRRLSNCGVAHRYWLGRLHDDRPEIFRFTCSSILCWVISFDARQAVSVSFLQRQHPLKGGCDFVHEFPRGLKNTNQLQFNDRQIRVFEILSSTAEARCLTRVDRNQVPNEGLSRVHFSRARVLVGLDVWIRPPSALG